jgi:hypothetical protein
LRSRPRTAFARGQQREKSFEKSSSTRGRKLPARWTTKYTSNAPCRSGGAAFSGHRPIALPFHDWLDAN